MRLLLTQVERHLPGVAVELIDRVGTLTSHTPEEVLSLDLTDTDLLGADLRDTDVRSAGLADALSLTQPQVNAMRGDRETTLPDDIARSAHWA